MAKAGPSDFAAALATLEAYEKTLKDQAALIEEQQQKIDALLGALRELHMMLRVHQ